MSASKDLNKYLPFLDYILDKTQDEHRQKFGLMRQWIADKKSLPDGYYEKMEKSILVQYKHFSNTPEFPQELHTIFAVDLCSDNEDEDDNSGKTVQSNESSHTKTAFKATTSNQVLVISEDEDDDVQVVSNDKRITNVDVNVRQNVSPDAHPKASTQWRSSKEIFNRISTTVTVTVHENNYENIPSTQTPPPLMLSPAHNAALPLDENNKPIFFRRGDLPVLSAVKDTDNVLESKKEISISPKKKKKHKKEKKSKKEKGSKKRHRKEIFDRSINEDNFNESKNNPLKSNPLDELNALLKLKENIILEIIEKTTPKESKPSGEELNNPPAKNLTHHVASTKVSQPNFTSFKAQNNSMENNTRMSHCSFTPVSANLLPNQSVESSSMEPKGSHSVTPTIPANPVSMCTQFIPSIRKVSPILKPVISPVPANAVQIDTQYMPSLPYGSLPPKPTAPTVLAQPAPISIHHIPPLDIGSPIPKPFSPPTLHAVTSPHFNFPPGYTNPSPPPPLQTSMTATQTKDPRIRKLLSHGQYGHNLSVGSSSTLVSDYLPPVANGPCVQSTIHAAACDLTVSASPAVVQKNGQYGVNNATSIQNVSAIAESAQWCDPQFAYNINTGISTHPKTQTMQWINPSMPSIRPATQNHGYTQSSITYGERRRMLEKQKLEEAKLVKEKEDLRKRQEAELTRLKKLKNDDEAKMRKERENQERTERIPEIHNKHKPIIFERTGCKENSAGNKRRQSTSFDGEKNCSQTENPALKKCRERRKSISCNRIYKELECTVKGFNTMQDFMSNTVNGKRRSSVSARKAIALHLNTENTVIHDVSTTKRQNKRLSSSSNESNVCGKRRRTIESPQKSVLPKMKRCTVVLTKLSKSDIIRHTHKKNSVKNKTPLPKSKLTLTMENDICKMSADRIHEKIPKRTADDHHTLVNTSTVVLKSSPEPLVIKNIDCHMTERQCKVCALCQKRSSDLTNHFIHVHKTESYVSRLNWEELDDLELKVPFAEEVPSKFNDSQIQRYKVECPFCPSDKSTVIASFQDLRRHYSTHTGEYAYSCKGCGLQKPYRDRIKTHQHHKKCDRSGVQTLYQYPPNQMVINMYLCYICNFVQLNKENVFKHLREQHGEFKKDPNYVKELTLAAIKDGPINRVPLSTLPNIMQERLLDQDQGDEDSPEKSPHAAEVFVSNEPLLDETKLGTIKTELEFQQNFENEFDEHNAFNDMEFISETFAANGTTTSTITKMPTALSNENPLIEESDIEFKPDVAALQHLLYSNDNLSHTQNENFQSESETFESKPNAEKLLAESVKALLRKYSANTGIRPDLLYKCPEKACGGFFSVFSLWLKHMKTHHNSIIAKCPHCCSNRKLAEPTEYPVEDFEQHFKIHCMKLYFCFHCDVSFTDENELRKHVAGSHTEFSKLRIECIPFNISYSFYIIIEETQLPDRVDFLLKLNEIFKVRVQHMDAMAEELGNLSTMWPVADNVQWLEGLKLPCFVPSVSPSVCLISTCLQRFPTQEQLLEHMYSHKIVQSPFKCRFCDMTYEGDWKLVFNHLLLHSEEIFVCCVCSYNTSYRPNMAEHIREQHNRRDVPLLHFFRSLKASKVELSFVFAAGTRTFTTTKSCFCGCGVANLRVDSFVSHLRREHSLKLLYFCDFCNEHLPHLQSSEEHHLNKHAQFGKEFKIRCQIALSKGRTLSIAAIRPLQICFSEEIYQAKQANLIGLLDTTQSIGITIKKEQVDDDNDDIIIMEEDEIIAEDELNKIPSASNQNGPSIKFLQINKNLF